MYYHSCYLEICVGFIYILFCVLPSGPITHEPLFCCTPRRTKDGVLFKEKIFFYRVI